MQWRWSYFKPEEVLSPVGLREYAVGNLLIQPFALDMLESFRKEIDVPLICNTHTLKYRGYRSTTENVPIGGSMLSRHLQGIAFDIHSTKLDAADLADAALEFGWGGIGLYWRKGFVHVDARPIMEKPRTWEG
jgi:zinc D-Ala-D-Ala carboxypeptidase